MALGDRRDSSLFRWDALNRAQQISLGLAIAAAVVTVALLVYATVAPARSDAPGAPHIWVALASRLGVAQPSPTPLPASTPTLTPLRIGIVAGHHGNDSGTVCADGLTEAEVNLDIAQRVASALRLRGYVVDLLDEYDPRLNNYRALLLLSIHADSCEFINEEATGFKAARVLNSTVPEAEDRLVACLVDRYAARTGMHFHANSITPDMTSYHGFYEVAPETPSAIIEVGFLYLDRPLLTQRPDLIAQGIVDGITCFLTGSQ
jgi:N-acetylmuramoyl-L-alanine amidase